MKAAQSMKSLRNQGQYKELGREHRRGERSKEISLILCVGWMVDLI